MTTGHIFDIKRYSLHDGPGIRTTVFLQGCPLSCWWCHNPESQSMQPYTAYHPQSCLGCEACVETCDQHALTLTADGVERDNQLCNACGKCSDACPSEAREFVGKEYEVSALIDIVERDRLYYESSGGGVTFSGGEPLSQVDFLLEALIACGERELHRAVDTSGLAAAKDLLAVAEHTDLFLFDLKVMDDNRHRQTTGVSNAKILQNLALLDANQHRTRVRVPVIPGVNDSVENFAQTAAFLADFQHVQQVDLLPYHPTAQDKHVKFDMPWKLNGAAASSIERLDERMSELAAVLHNQPYAVTIGG